MTWLNCCATPEGAGISDETNIEADVTPRLGDLLVAAGKAKREDVEALAGSQSGKPIGVEMVQKESGEGGRRCPGPSRPGPHERETAGF